MTQFTSDKSILSVSKSNGWNIQLFEDQNALKAFVCTACNSVCCDAAELGCDHNDEDIYLYCHVCLQDVIKQNNGKCPIDMHIDPVISPARSSRRQILKLMVFCPYSTFSNKLDDFNDIGEVMDTVNGDEKEGDQQVEKHELQLYTECNWKGTLNDLINIHITQCSTKNDATHKFKIKVKDLQNQLHEQKSKNERELKEKQNNINLQAAIINELKQQIKAFHLEVNVLDENVRKVNMEKETLQNEITKLKEQNKTLKQQVNEQSVLIQDMVQNMEHKSENQIEGTQLKAKITDRVDCLLNCSGEIIKYQVVGNVTLVKQQKHQDTDHKEDEYFYGIIDNLRQTKKKIFNTVTCEELDNKGNIRVKLQDDDANTAVLKYLWTTENLKQYFPFVIELKTEIEQNNCNVTIVLTPNKHKGLLTECAIMGSINRNVSECIEYTMLDNIQFVWSKNDGQKFMWKIKNDVDQQYVLVSKFRGVDFNDYKVQLKLQFGIRNIGISNIQIKHDINNQNNNAYISKTERSVCTGEFIVR